VVARHDHEGLGRVVDDGGGDKVVSLISALLEMVAEPELRQDVLPQGVELGVDHHPLSHLLLGLHVAGHLVGREQPLTQTAGAVPAEDKLICLVTFTKLEEGGEKTERDTTVKRAGGMSRSVPNAVTVDEKRQHFICPACRG